jgi:hypothetical protein
MHDLSLYLLEVIENSVRAGATVVATTIVADRAAGTLAIDVQDDGPGLPVQAEDAMDPFYTTKQHKKTGLGLSLFRQAAEDAGGGLTVGRSDELGGVAVHAWLALDNVDRPPLGDVAASILTMVATNPGIDFRVHLIDGDERVEVRGSELPQRLPVLVAYQQTLT